MLGYAEIDLSMKKGRDEIDTPGIGKVFQYLRDRGLDQEDVKALGLHIVPAGTLIDRARGAKSNFEDSRLAIVFPHFEADGTPIDWWSARLVDAGLRPKIATSFSSFTEQKLGKMFCPPQEPPHAYLVPTLDWTKLARGDKVYIHESCIKAINGAKLGYWSVGLNGVRGWSSRKHGIALVDEIRGLPWKALDLRPVIVFDSNAADNWDVQHAISSIAAKLYEVTGQKATHILLPPGPEGHWGFDDFVVTRGAEEASAFLEGEGAEVEISELETKKLQLNNEVCVVRSLGRIAEQATGTLMTRSTFLDVNYATFVASLEDKMVSVPRLWLQDSRRMEVEKLEYSPGEPNIVPGEFLNLWRGWGVEPQEGDVTPWLALLEHNIPDPEIRKWVIQWFAYPLQNPGQKTTAYLHLYSPPGTGKNALLAPVLRIYGDNSISLGKERIISDFNSVYATKQFVNLDELHGGSDKDGMLIANKIKRLATAERLEVNMKGQPEYSVRNHIQLVTTSNYADAIKLDEGDRRACVIQFGTPDDVIRESAYWVDYFTWGEGDGAAALFHYLLSYDLSDFDAKGSAPDTEWKGEVMDATLGAMEKWARDITDDFSMLPEALRKRVLTPEQLGLAYVDMDQGKNTKNLRNQLGLRLSALGSKRARKVELKVEGQKKRVWIIAEADRDWTNDEIKAELKKLGGKF